MFVRRTAALRLVQMVAGGSLGIATARTTWRGRIYSGVGHVHSNAKKQPVPHGFETSLMNLVSELGHRKRQIASIHVWVQLTSGEHHFGPRPIEEAQPHQVQREWKSRRNTIWHLMQNDRQRPHYTDLKSELNALAVAIARRIDNYQSQAQSPVTESGIQVDLGHWRDVVDDALDFGPIRSQAGSCDLAKAAVCEGTSVAVTTPAP